MQWEFIDGIPVIIMEYIEGITLSDLLKVQKLSLAEKQAIFLKLLHAVAHAHEKGIVHRDLKPDNIFITTEGEVKLGDFGIAYVLDATTSLTKDGGTLGTPAYMAPEQITGDKVDTRADVFSLGALAYELFVGENPFSSGKNTHFATIIHRITGEGVIDYSQLDENAGAFSKIVKEALQKNPKDRYKNAGTIRIEWKKIQDATGESTQKIAIKISPKSLAKIQNTVSEKPPKDSAERT